MPDSHQQKEEIIISKKDVKNFKKDINIEESSIPTKSRNDQEKSSDNGTPEILASIEISDGANKKPFRGLGLLNKSQLKLASYIKQNKNVTLEGTKRFMDKSGEYYLKNIQLQNKKRDNKRKSLNKPLNLENCLKKRDFNKIKRKASKIVTLLPENSLTPIPKKKGVKDNNVANIYDKKELDEAQRTAVFIRRMEYSTSMKRQIVEDKNAKEFGKKIGLIQQWWKAMFKIIKLQKNLRGFFFRKKLMNTLDHQEKLLQFITEFDNIHSYHLYKQFMENLKKKRDYENSKLMEKCEDFNEKLDNLEKMHNYKNFKNCFEKWKTDTKNKRTQVLNDLIHKLDNILLNKKKEEKQNSFNKLIEKIKEQENELNDIINKFKEKQAKKNFFNDLIKMHKINKELKNKEKLKNYLTKWKNIIDDMNKRKKILEKLIRYKENEIKKKKEEENNKLVIASKINQFEVLSDIKNPENNEVPKNNKIFISPQNEINILMEPQKKLLQTQNYQSFSLIAPDKIQFNFGTPLKNNQKLNNHISIQLDNVIAFLKNKSKEKEDNNFIIKKNKNDLITIKSKDNKECLNNALNKLIEILEKAQNESDKEIKREVLDKLKHNINMGKLTKILDGYFKKRLEQNKNKEINDNDELKNVEIRQSFMILKKFEIENTFKQILTISKQYDNEIQGNKENKENKENNNEKSEDKSDENNFKIIQKKNILFTMKKEENTEPENKISSTKKRIAYRRSPIKNKNINKKKLKKALDKWKSNSSLMNKDIYDKYKRKVLQDLLKLYQKGKDILLKKYFDKWKNKENKDDNIDNDEILKYKKKPRMEYKSDIIEEYEQETIKDNDTFIPVYILPKENLHKVIIDNPYIDESVHEPMDSNNNIEKTIPYIKKYGQRNYNKDNDKEMNGLNQYNKISKNKKEKANSSDNSSEESSSYLSGITLIQNNKEIKLPRNYISQSYFIDKPLQNSYSNNNNNNSKTDIYKINQIPNMMKGDFGNFLENNPKIFKKKNPRIQITRSTCDINNIFNNPINNDLILNNNKVLSRIVKNCDYDLYANQQSKSKKDKWYSMSIPLNQIKPTSNYKNMNKNEMIEKNENDQRYKNYKPIKSLVNIHKENNGGNNDYTLQEMNCSQFYRSPIRSIKKNKFGEKFQLYDTVIKIPGKQRRNIHQSLSPFDSNRRRYYYSQFE